MNNNLKKNKNSKKNKFLRRRLFALLIFLLLLMFFTNLIRANRVNNYKTIFPTLTTYEKDIDTKIYNLFEEKAYFAKGDGIAVFHTSEGQKVPLGYEVANLNLMEDVSSLKDELNKVNSAIKIKNGIEPHEKENPKSFTKNIQDSIKNEDYQNLYFDINSPDNDFNPNLNESELKEYLEMSKENLLNKKSDLENKISKYNYSYLAEFSGIVSYKIDGNEKHFKLDNLDKFTYKYLNKNYDFKNIEMETQVKKGDPLFKIINNLNWKLACTIIDVDSNHAVIIVNLDRYFENMYSNRIHEGKIIVNKTKVFEIPKSTLIERNNLIGVYVEEIKGLVKFVPVDIISESNESVFINKGNKQSVINIGEKSYQTVTVNDALVINPKTVDESRILN